MVEPLIDFLIYLVMFSWGVLRMLLISALILGVPYILWRICK